jgi:MurNAc alpha-1-phosphate uridylyltransferase
MMSKQPPTPYSSNNTSVLLLAAGRGQRMMPLTANTPKPLLKVGEHSLIQHHLNRLAELGFINIVINLAYLGEQIQQQVYDFNHSKLNIRFSDESICGALETAGGIQHALPLLDSDPFLVVNSDIWTDFNFTQILSPLKLSARLVLVENPEHNLQGDFHLHSATAKTPDTTRQKLTFSGIALYKKSLFKQLKHEKRALAPLLHNLVEQQQLETIKHAGIWHDIGTPKRLNEINRQYG